MFFKTVIVCVRFGIVEEESQEDDLERQNGRSKPLGKNNVATSGEFYL